MMRIDFDTMKDVTDDIAATRDSDFIPVSRDIDVRGRRKAIDDAPRSLFGDKDLDEFRAILRDAGHLD